MWSIFICNEKGGDQSYSKENIVWVVFGVIVVFFVVGLHWISFCIIVQSSLWFMIFVPCVSQYDYVYNKPSTVT